jgi:CubicO group peptidase (beta-lactamase class C family)
MKNKMRLLVLIFMQFLILIGCRKEEIIDVNSKENLDKVMESVFKRYQMPGFGYVAVKGDSIVYMGAKGYANIHDKIDFTPQTRMLIASVSKTMAVTAIMQLYDKGLVDLDEDINRYLPFEVRNPNFPDDKITIKMLLTHTSSIVDKGYPASVYYLFGYVDYPISNMNFQENYLTLNGKYYTEHNFSKDKPGSKWSYSNVAAALTACLVEQVSKMDYNTYCKTNIFEPLGMTRTTWFFSETPKNEVAIPYDNNDIDNPTNPFFSFPTYPDGHLMTSVEDLSKFMRAYMNGGSFNNYQLLKPETVDLILQEHFNNSNEQQGLIFFNTKQGEISVWGHDGADPGVSTEMFFNKEQKTGYIMFINRSFCYPEVAANALLKYANQ